MEKRATTNHIRMYMNICILYVYTYGQTAAQQSQSEWVSESERNYKLQFSLLAIIQISNYTWNFYYNTSKATETTIRNSYNYKITTTIKTIFATITVAVGRYCRACNKKQ